MGDEQRGAAGGVGVGQEGRGSGPVRIAVAGSGYGCRVALEVYRQSDRFEPLGVWSRRAERAREAAAKAGVANATDSFEELLDTPGLEAVHIATPVFMHAEMARAAAGRGLHVLLEKPIGMDLPEARSVRAAVEDAGVVCALNLSRRYQQARQRMAELVREVAGPPRMVSISLVHSDHATPQERPFTWVSDAALGGGRLQAYGIHDLDFVSHAIGPVAAVAADLAVQVPERTGEHGPRPVSAEDAYALLVRFDSGGLGVITLVATARHRRGDLIEVHGERGTVRLDGERRLWWGRAGEELRCEGPLKADSQAAFGCVAERFGAAVRHGAPPEPSLQEGLELQALMDAVRRAASERRWVEVERP